MGETRDVEFTADAIVFHGYAFPGARVHPGGSVPWSEVREVDLDKAPPEVRLAGETLFVSATRKDELRRAAAEHGVPDVPRVDVWDMLLDPFLDTVFDEEFQERTLARLERNGVSREEAARIRERVGKRMLAYNFDTMLWEWVHLGMWDLFHAHLPSALERAIRGDGPFRELYRWAQEIDHRAGVDEFMAARHAGGSAGGDAPSAA